jgi:hypothetical protein
VVSLVNSDVELGFCIYFVDALDSFASVMELLYIGVILGRNGRFTEKVLLIRRAMEDARYESARVPIRRRRPGPSVSNCRSWVRPTLVG